MKLVHIFTGAVCLFFGWPTAWAQTPDLSQATLEELMNIKVVTASKYLQSSQSAPSLVTVVTADEIQKYGYRTLADVLRSVGAFYVTYDRNYSYVGVRGFARPGDYNVRILLLVDGHRLNDSVYGLAFVGSEFLLDLDLVDRVEIIRGPSSSLYGTNAFFGVINVITKRGEQFKAAELSSSVGSFGSYGGRATYGNRFHNLDLLLSGTYYTSSGQDLFFPEFNQPANNYGVARNADDDRSRSFYAQLSLGNLSLRGAMVSREKGIPTASFGTVFNNPAVRTFDSVRSLDAQYYLSRNGWDLSFRAFHDLYSYDGRYVWWDSATSRPILNADGCRGEWWGGEARATRELPAHNKLTAGVEIRHDARQDQFSYDVQPYWLYVDDHRHSWIWALYAQDEIRLSRKLLLNLGLRHDRYPSFGSTTNPRAALIFQPAAGANLKLLYGTAFRAPSAYELYYTGFSLKGNPGLVPETIRSFELIFEKEFSRHVRTAVSAYNNKIDNLISQTIDLTDGFTVFRNLDRVRSNGLEVETAAKWLTGLETRASYNLQRTTDRSTDRLLTNSPVHLAKLGAIVPLIKYRLFVSPDLWYMSRRRTLNGASVGGFPLVNVNLLGRNLGRHTDLSAGLYNLFDKNYADPGAEEHVQDTLRQDGRNFRVKLTLRF
ncbi:MAG TPA: TonB-dependent receptor [Terriglobales bacterium]